VQDEAVRNGYTVLLDGARRHWSLWEAADARLNGKGNGPCSIEEAERRKHDPAHPWHRKTLRRYKTYTSLNALIQGSAARLTKQWMLACYREGIVPHIQMHDALECSVRTREEGELIGHLGEETGKQLRVPMRVDVKYGRSWGDATHTWEELTGSPPAPGNVVPFSPPAGKMYDAATSRSHMRRRAGGCSH
jgi:DNA polymerase I-like protein with 3'-5' exonuclease and polymerase domains